VSVKRWSTGFITADVLGVEVGTKIVLAADYDALKEKFDALAAGGVLEYTDPDNGDKVTVCPTCGQSHCGSSRDELRPKLVAAGLADADGEKA
jgi:hypothetical protein